MNNANGIPLPSIDGYEFSTPSGGTIEVRCVRTGFGVVLSVDDADYIGKPCGDPTRIDSDYRIDISAKSSDGSPLVPSMRWGVSHADQLCDSLPWLDGIEIYGTLSGELIDEPEVNVYGGLSFDATGARVYTDGGDAYVPMWAVACGPMAAAIEWLCADAAERAYEAACERRAAVDI